MNGALYDRVYLGRKNLTLSDLYYFQMIFFIPFPIMFIITLHLLAITSASIVLIGINCNLRITTEG